MEIEILKRIRLARVCKIHVVELQITRRFTNLVAICVKGIDWDDAITQYDNSVDGSNGFFSITKVIECDFYTMAAIKTVINVRINASSVMDPSATKLPPYQNKKI